MWLIEEAQKTKQNLDIVVQGILVSNFAAIHTSSNVSGLTIFTADGMMFLTRISRALRIRSLTLPHTPNMCSHFVKRSRASSRNTVGPRKLSAKCGSLTVS